VGVLYDYFAAPDDAAAGAVIDEGPAGLFETVATKIDCVVELAYVEELLGGRSVDEQLDDPRTGGVVEQCDERLVLSISEEMQAALASLPDAELPQIARMWAQAEEFEGAADPAHLELVLRDLRALSQTATERTLGLYCWACV
jgi:hypothetical protein